MIVLFISYPFIFEEEGTLYLVPECSKKNSIDVYECVKFPFRWKFKQTLIENFKGLDNTIFKKDGYFWLFTTLSQTDELHLFYTKELWAKNWTPHPNNPLYNDVSKSRMAGKIVNLENQIYRFAQNGSKRYGYGMQIFKINKISDSHFSEEKIQQINPNWSEDIIATHTFNHTNKLSVTDGLVRRFKF